MKLRKSKVKPEYDKKGTIHITIRIREIKEGKEFQASRTLTVYETTVNEIHDVVYNALNQAAGEAP